MVMKISVRPCLLGHESDVNLNAFTIMVPTISTSLQLSSMTPMQSLKLQCQIVGRQSQSSELLTCQNLRLWNNEVTSFFDYLKIYCKRCQETGTLSVEESFK